MWLSDLQDESLTRTAFAAVETAVEGIGGRGIGVC